MKKYFLIALLFLAPLIAGAQDIDSTLVGSSIYSVMPRCVRIDEPRSVQRAVQDRMFYNSTHKVQGFRIRIFLDNGQSARGESAAVLERFSGEFPGIPATRSFSNSYFKVTVGSYRTRSDAMRAFETYKLLFPKAFIVEEELKFPSL